MKSRLNLIKKLKLFKLQGDTINGYGGGNAALALPTPPQGTAWNCVTALGIILGHAPEHSSLGLSENGVITLWISGKPT
jgi:hypothetical protein